LFSLYFHSLFIILPLVDEYIIFFVFLCIVVNIIYAAVTSKMVSRWSWAARYMGRHLKGKTNWSVWNFVFA